MDRRTVAVWPYLDVISRMSVGLRDSSACPTSAGNGESLRQLVVWQECRSSNVRGSPALRRPKLPEQTGPVKKYPRQEAHLVLS